MLATGLQVKSILESTFDGVYNEDVVCVLSNGVTIKFHAIVHTEIVRARRDHFTSDNSQGVLDRHSLGIILLNRDIQEKGLTKIPATSYFLVDNIRYDFSLTEPYLDDRLTPYKGAGDVFAVFYVRKAAELERQKSTSGESGFSFKGKKSS